MVRLLSMHVAVMAAAVACMAAPTEAAPPRQPHETMVRHPPPPTPVDMDVWLRRLVGRFRWEGVLDTNPMVGAEDGTDLVAVKGMSDCAAIGEGPGVQCVMDVRWLEGWGLEGSPIAVPNLTPAMAMYGLDPVHERFVYMQVDNKGLAVGGPGGLRDATATLRAPCIGTDLPLRVPATPGSIEPASDQQSPGGGSLDASTSGTSSATGGAQAGAGSQAAVRFRPPVNSISAEPAPWMPCVWTTRITARPEKNLIFLDIEYGDRMEPTNRFTLTLRRITPQLQ